MRYWTYSVAALLLIATGTSAGAEPIGATVKVVNKVTAAFESDTRPLAEGDGVNQNEIIAVAADALGEIAFKDQTKLALGPGSQLKLDKFVYDPEKTGSAITVDLLKGTFRFMTGVAEKPAYVIRTPSASITVRGTIFDVYIREDGATWLLLHEGAVAVRNQRGKCNLLDTPGRLIRVTGNGDVGIPVNWKGMPGSQDTPFDEAFPFVAKPPSLDPKPLFTEQAILNAPEVNSSRSLSCDESRENPKKPVQQRADDDDSRPALKKDKAVRSREVDDEPTYTPKKPVRKVKDEDDKPTKVIVEKPVKVVVPVKPKKPKPDRGGNYGEKDENVKIMDGIGIAISVGGGFGKGNRGGKGPSRGGDNSGAKTPKMSKPNYNEIPR